MTVFHRHVWKITAREEHPSGIDLLRMVRAANFKGDAELLRRPVIVTYRCERCGSEKVVRR